MSKYPPTSNSTIESLTEIFSRNGLPHTSVTDNATIFKSQEFTTFCKKNGVQQKYSAPNHPATNGQAERMIQNFKSKMNAMANEQGNIKDKLIKFLFKYRDTPLECGKTPAELYPKRKLRTRLDLSNHKFEKIKQINNATK